PIVVTNLRLRLPVLEEPDGGLIQPPSGKVLPEGYALAPDVTVGIDDTCVPASTTTTSTTTSTTEDTITTTTTTTTTLPSYSLTLSRVKVKAERSDGSSDGRVDAQGSLTVPPDFSAQTPFSVRIQD